MVLIARTLIDSWRDCGNRGELMAGYVSNIWDGSSVGQEAEEEVEVEGEEGEQRSVQWGHGLQKDVQGEGSSDSASLEEWTAMVLEDVRSLIDTY